MDGDDVYHILMLGFAVGTLGLVYHPSLVAAMIPYLALLGAFYFVFGIVCNFTGFAFGVGRSRKEDWLAGFAILVFVGIIMGYTGLAVSSVQFMVRLFTSLFGLLFNLA